MRPKSLKNRLQLRKRQYPRHDRKWSVFPLFVSLFFFYIERRSESIVLSPDVVGWSGAFIFTWHLVSMTSLQTFSCLGWQFLTNTVTHSWLSSSTHLTGSNVDTSTQNCSLCRSTSRLRNIGSWVYVRLFFRGDGRPVLIRSTFQVGLGSLSTLTH